MTVFIEHRLPNIAEFIDLRAGTHWDKPCAQVVQKALGASLCGAVAIKGGTTIGMVRAVGDGALNIYIQDVIIAKSERSSGIGTALLGAFISKLADTYPPSCTIGLFAAEGQERFYEYLGFVSRPSNGFGPGMHVTLSNLTQPELAKAHDAA